MPEYYERSWEHWYVSWSYYTRSEFALPTQFLWCDPVVCWLCIKTFITCSQNFLNDVDINSYSNDEKALNRNFDNQEYKLYEK